jgi:hypothetical protein
MGAVLYLARREFALGSQFSTKLMKSRGKLFENELYYQDWVRL